MKVLYYDCFAGISGDMNIGALLDLGVPKEHLQEELGKLNIEDEYSLEIIPSSKMGIHGTKFNVKLEHHHHDDHDHHHRHLSHIESLIMESALTDEVKNISMNIFHRVAEAEAKIHNTSIEKVHFHEVGAVDSIIDIVGGSICLEYLKVDKIFSSPVQLGGGFVRCAHGVFPVPAPATLEIIKNIPVNLGKVMHEATTPTGAAIIAEISDKFVYPNNMKVLSTGYGIGGRDVEIPNVLRVILGEI
jgi:uncharacterized protein (TIGR00299 family) protein